MNKEKPKRIVIHGCYSALNSDLGIRDKKGKIMKGEHDVFVIAKASKRGYVIVKTITSIENSNTGTFQQKSIEFVKIGRIIPIPIKDINSKKLCGFW